MAPLKKEEIYAELKRLGISTPLEREAYLNDYVEYFTSYNNSPLDRFAHKLKNVFSRHS